MTDLDIARTQITEIIQWWDALGDEAETATGVIGHRLSMAGVHGPPRDATETAVLQIDAIDTIVQEIQALAVKLGWRPRLDGDPKIYILGHLDWAQMNLAPIEWAAVINDLHRRVGAITGHAPRATGRQCPLCGEALRILPPPRPSWQTVDERLKAAEVPDRFTCDGCEETRDADEIKALTSWRLMSSGTLMTAHEAAKSLNLPAGTIRKRIFDRKLDADTRHGSRRYYLKDLV